jgi:uncharacterized metal-binding protein YceD (DUF177 family)
VKDLNQFEVDLFQLRNGLHEYNFEVRDEFFQLLGTNLTDRGNLHVHVTLEKNIDYFKLTFHIKGFVILICDRSLEEYQHYIDVTRNLVIRYGERNEEVGDELETISPETVSINLAKNIYEYIGLEIPYKKLHPRFREQDYHGNEDPLIYQTETYKKEDIEGDIDPRWKALLKLKEN